MNRLLSPSASEPPPGDAPSAASASDSCVSCAAKRADLPRMRCAKDWRQGAQRAGAQAGRTSSSASSAARYGGSVRTSYSTTSLTVATCGRCDASNEGSRLKALQRDARPGERRCPARATAPTPAATCPAASRRRSWPPAEQHARCKARGPRRVCRQGRASAQRRCSASTRASRCSCASAMALRSVPTNRSDGDRGAATSRPLGAAADA